MRKLRTLCLLLVLLLLCGCESHMDTKDHTTTLMVYMVGSDLEAMTGAATSDLQEMAQSGVDPERCNVVICAGGSPKWHNEFMQEQTSAILQLTADGFSKAADGPAGSMGTAEPLQDFLNYAAEAYPADKYALILWDHGNGPVIGYGKDMLFENDSLTLSEMKQALDGSPFTGENKLEWIGFDACLMASAELACVLGDHAEYLIASQEVEPAFGWDYSFLAQLGSKPTAVARTILDTYMARCTEYYASKGLSHRDTTLSCMDLSYARDLQAAMDALFEAASADVTGQYSQLTVRRVQSRALGRATTGSEYDLVDLKSLTDQFSSLYPDQTKQIHKVLKDMVVFNETNADGCCGLSLYYPFYNKHYYTTSWGETYSELGIFPQYSSFLTRYENIWLNTDMLDSYADSAKPEEAAQGIYTLQLTEEQADNLAAVRYHILAQEGNGLFNRLFTSYDVTNKDGLLTANFDGNIIYAKNDYGARLIPRLLELDAVGDLSRYQLIFSMENIDESSIYSGYGGTVTYYPQFDTDHYRMQLTLDRNTDEVYISSLTPTEEGSQQLQGGKLEDVSLSDFDQVVFHHGYNLLLSRYDNGAIKPLSQWPDDGWISYTSYPVNDGVHFVCEPLESGNYYVIFEMEDTQGSQYCSELLPVAAGTAEPEDTHTASPIEVQWDSGDRVVLMEQDDVCVYLKKLGESFTVGVTNDRDTPISFSVNNYIVDEEIFMQGSHLDGLAPGDTSERDIPIFQNSDLLMQSGLLQDPKTFSCRIAVEDLTSWTTLIYDQPVIVHLNNEEILDQLTPAPAPVYMPCLGAKADAQTFTEYDGLEITMHGCGADRNYTRSDLRGYFTVRNTSNVSLQARLIGATINGSTYIPISSSANTLAAGEARCTDFSIPSSAFPKYGILDIHSLELVFSITGDTGFWGNFAETVRFPVSLSAAAALTTKLTEGDIVLFEKEDVRVSLKEFEADKTGNAFWQLAIVNDSDRDISLALADPMGDGVSLEQTDALFSAHLMYAQVPAHQRTLAELSLYPNDDLTDQPLPEELTFSFQLQDFNEEAILFTDTQTITLQTE